MKRLITEARVNALLFLVRGGGGEGGLAKTGFLAYSPTTRGPKWSKDEVRIPALFRSSPTGKSREFQVTGV